MATKKSAGVSRNGRDSNSRRLGLKLYGKEFVYPGCIILKQKSLKIIPGENTKFGKDYTIFSLIFGYINFKKRSNTYYVYVLRNL